MGLVARESEKKKRELLPEANHVANCYSIVDIGTHYSEFYKKWQHKVFITWEIPEERIEVERDGDKVDLPKVKSQKYTLSLHENAVLRKHLEGWRGRKFTKAELQGFDLENVLGKPCQIQIMHDKKEDGKVFDPVSNITPLPKGFAGKEIENDLFFFFLPQELDAKGNKRPEYDQELLDTEIPAEMQEWLVKMLEDSSEWKLRSQLMNGNGDQATAEESKPITEDVTDYSQADSDDIPF